MMLFVFFTLFLYVGVHISIQDGNNMTIIYNDTYLYNSEYTVTVNNYTEYIILFNSEHVLNIDNPVRITVNSKQANNLFPVFITARQAQGILTWKLPMRVETPMSTETFYNVSRTMCPHNNYFKKNEDLCDEQRQSPNVVLHISTMSSINTDVIFKIETVNDFYLHINENVNLTVTSSTPKYYFYSFELGAMKLMIDTMRVKKKYICKEPMTPDEETKLNEYLINSLPDNNHNFEANKDLRESSVLHSQDVPKSVILMIESDNDVCAVISIQNYSCPVFDTERDILYEGNYLTMTRKGGITLTQESFPLGFYIVFIVKSSDEDCQTTFNSNSTNNNTLFQYFNWDLSANEIDVTNEDGRMKHFSFTIVPTISYRDYWIATGATLSVIVVFYLIFLPIIFCCGPKDIVGVENVTDTGTSAQTQVYSVEDGTTSVSTAVSTSQPQTRLTRRSVNQTVHSRANSPPSEETVESNIYIDDDHAPPNYSTVINRPAPCTAQSDSSDDGDNVSQYSMLRDTQTEKDIYRLPHTLCLADLSKKGARVLSGRSNLYFWHLSTVAVFYCLPVVQLVTTYQMILNRSGNQDTCYYNFLCAHPLGLLSDFNHVYSNLGYIMLGLLFLIQVWSRQRREKIKPNNPDVGIPKHYGLFYSMGLALIIEGFLSGSYHVCPNHMNFQFDTSFMYVMAILCMVKLYQSRHPDINARAHSTFCVLAAIILLGLFGVLKASFTFWILFTIIHIATCFYFTFQIYYMGRFRLSGVLRRAGRELVTTPMAAVTPNYVGRMVLLLLANLTNWLLAAYGVYQSAKDFASHLLLILLANLMLYILFYIVMKLLHRETIRAHTWMFIIVSHLVWFSSAYFFVSMRTSWALTPAQSRQFNERCDLLQFYDYHDIWHLLSALALFLSFNMMLTMDDGLEDTPRRNIKVF